MDFRTNCSLSRGPRNSRLCKNANTDCTSILYAIALAMLLRLSRVAGLLSLVAAASLSNPVGDGGWGRLTKKKLARLNAQ